MKEHPIPQDITGYRFHIVGSMTLKQFGEVGVGVLLAGLVYSTNLVNVIKFPIMFLLFALGIIAAFLPLGERPLSHWLTTFFRILYKPTQFFWKRADNVPEVFMFQPKAETKIQYKELDLSPARRQRIKEFLSSSHEEDFDETDFSIEEQQQMVGILSLFGTQLPQIDTSRGRSLSKPTLGIRVREMRALPNSSPDAGELSEANLGINQPNKDAAKVDVFQLSPDLPTIQDDPGDTKKSYLEAAVVAQNIAIPEQSPVKIQPSTQEELEAAGKPKHSQEDGRVFIEQKTDPIRQSDVKTEKGQFNATLPFPNKPTEPNKLVGMVLTPENELIPGAIVEIRTKDGKIVRAVKTNALGQFFVTTALKKGDYVVEVEKEGYEFKPFAVQLKNKIIDPLEVRSE